MKTYNPFDIFKSSKRENPFYINDLFCSPDLSLKLKECGFDEECFAGYDAYISWLKEALYFPAASQRNSTTKPRTYKKNSSQNQQNSLLW